MRSFLLAVVGFFAFAAPNFAAEPADYLRSVKPLLTARCYACHGALQQKSKLRLDTVELMKKGGESGAVIVPGNSKKSLLFAHITATGNTSRMPPESEGEPLKATEIEAIRAWIEQGAAGPADEKPETDPKDHWAFKTPVRPPVPKTAEGKNPIDAFLAAEYVKHGLKPQIPADKRVLLRRIYLDLIGFPPTREEYDAFLADTSATAYEKVVDRLLASKQYAERWGRHWMDIWRYSEWWGLGAEVRNSQKHIRHWRDWILDSLDADKAYDQMVREMLAADELYPTDADRLRATGFLARQYFKFNRNTWLEETVEHTSKAFLGLTMNCAKCHDHKYDPFAQQDFYRMRAYFEPYQVRTDMVKSEANFEKDGIPRAFDCNLEAPTYLFVRGNEQNPKKDRSIPPGVPEILQFDKFPITPVTLPPEAQNPGLRADVIEGYRTTIERQIAMAEEALTQARKSLTEIEKKGDPVPKKEEPKKVEPKKEEPTPKLTALVVDDFAKEKPELWEFKSGKWKHESGKLVQSQTGAERGVMRLKTKVPHDFEARWKYTTLGGDMWKSVGLSFDVANANEVMVYLSAYSGGSKLQVSYKQGAGYVYPPAGTQMREVKLNQLQDVEVRVRDRLINVRVNGKHSLAYQLPIARQAGAMELITFDAKAEFTGFELAVLPANVKLMEAGNTTAIPEPKMPEIVTIASAKQAVSVAEKALASAKAQLESLTARVAADRARLTQPPAKDVDQVIKAAALAEKKAALATAEENLARAELEAQRSPAPKKAEADKKLVAAKDAFAKAQKEAANPGTTYTSLRGSLKTLESNLESEASRSKPFPATSTGRRSALAKWMTDHRNPLTARVAVNHIWARHFGKPLVTTVFDFGRKGNAPTHPELLDWLAVEFMEQKWSMKHVHKLMVMSNTYQMSSSAKSPDATANVAMIDAENRWYWRMNPIRMEAQVIRDSLLHLGGELDLTVGGPSIPANADSLRRSLYFFQSHNEHHKFLSTFDDANVLECYRRAESIIPQQSLALENSRLAMNAAEKIARRLDVKEDEAFIKTAFVVILGSPPSKEEQAECATALKEFQAIAMQQKRAEPAMRARTNFIHALLNHNDFVTVR